MGEMSGSEHGVVGVDARQSSSAPVLDLRASDSAELPHVARHHDTLLDQRVRSDPRVVRPDGRAGALPREAHITVRAGDPAIERQHLQARQQPLHPLDQRRRTRSTGTEQQLTSHDGRRRPPPPRRHDAQPLQPARERATKACPCPAGSAPRQPTGSSSGRRSSSPIWGNETSNGPSDANHGRAPRAAADGWSGRRPHCGGWPHRRRAPTHAGCAEGCGHCGTVGRDVPRTQRSVTPHAKDMPWPMSGRADVRHGSRGTHRLLPPAAPNGAAQ
jgi:hypothetical protein